MAQWLRALTVLPKVLSSNPRNHMVAERERDRERETERERERERVRERETDRERDRQRDREREGGREVFITGQTHPSILLFPII